MQPPKTVIKKPVRRTGPIPKLKGNGFPKELLFFDTETKIIKLGDKNVIFPLKFGVAIYVNLNPDHSIKKRTVLRFDSAASFVDILKTYATGRKTIYVFAHNIKFDIMVLNLPLALYDKGIKSQFPIINERMFIWRATHSNAHCVFLDTANFGIISVEQIGKDIGKPKLKINFNTCTDDELFIYCRNDCEVIEEFMLSYIKFVNTNELGGFRFTLASQSMAAWRKRFMKATVNIHNNEYALKLERAAYHGGRTECFSIGKLPKQDYYYLDVNSMYPYIMKTSNVPTEHLKNIENPTLDKLQKCVSKYYVIADIELETDIPAYALVDKGKLLFPTGRFRTVLHHGELSYALQHKHIKRVFGLSIYLYRNIFGYYVDFFYNLKQENKRTGNKSWYLISKLFQNSLYGKMAQSGIVESVTEGPYQRIIKREEGHDLDDYKYNQSVNWFGTVIQQTRQGESSYSFPACAGAITANARMLLLYYIECAGWENVYYCDTDSLIVNNVGLQALYGAINEYELGQLKLEKQSQRVVIFGSKDYVFGKDVRHKGISPKAKMIGRDKWKALQFGGILPFMNEGFEGFAKAKTIIKTRKNEYNKAYTGLHPYRVFPLIYVLDEAGYSPLPKSDPLVLKSVERLLS